MSYQRKATNGYDRLSANAKARIADAGLSVMRGGLLARELSTLTEATEKGRHGNVVSHLKIDPEKVAYTEELVGLGLAYQPKSKGGRPQRAVLTRLGEEVAGIAARLAYGPNVELEAKKYSVLDDVDAYLNGALYHLEHGTRNSGSRRFTPQEKRRLSALVERTRGLRSDVAEFRDSFEVYENRSSHGVRVVRRSERDRSATRRGRS